MYPLNVVLAGTSEAMLVDVRRELDNIAAAIEAEYLDLATALTALPGLPHEKRFLLITHVKSANDLKLLGRLSEACAGQPIVALVDLDQDGAMVLKAMRAGASQVVPLPLQVEDFQAALHRIAVQHGPVGGDAKVIAVSGSSEGCGATTIALNLAHEIGVIHKQPVVLVELATHLGRLASYLDIQPRFTICDLLSDMERLEQETVRRALTRISDHLAVLPGPFAGIVPATPPSASVVRLLQCLRQLGGVLVLDLPYYFDTTYFEALAQAQRIVLVVDQRVPSVHALKLVLDMIARKEIAASRHVVVNRYEAGTEEFTVKRLQELLSTANILTIANDYPRLVTAANEGKSLREVAPNCRAMADIHNLAIALAGQPPQTYKRSFLSRLAHPFEQA